MKIDVMKLGFSIIPDFISVEEEQMLFPHIDTKKVNKSGKNRNSIRRYGSSGPYRGNLISATIPDHFTFLLDRLVEQKLVPVRPNSVAVNEYLAGQMITPHIDSNSSGDVITVLSLMSDATMIFQLSPFKESVLLPARSISQMSGEIRYKWQHSIKPVESQRYSIVFRHG